MPCVHLGRDNEANAAPGAQQLFLQFLTRYMHWSGELRLRVSTVTRRWIEGSAVADLITGRGVGESCGVRYYYHTEMD